MLMIIKKILARYFAILINETVYKIIVLYTIDKQ